MNTKRFVLSLSLVLGVILTGGLSLTAAKTAMASVVNTSHNIEASSQPSLFLPLIVRNYSTPPEDAWAWLNSQTFDASLNGCNPGYPWWGLVTDVVQITSSFVLNQTRADVRTILWGTEVTMDSIGGHNAVIWRDGSGSWSVSMPNGGHVLVGRDSVGLYPEYLARQLACNFSGTWTVYMGPVPTIPTNTPAPSATPTATNTSLPTATPTATNTPESTNTPEPTATVFPNDFNTWITTQSFVSPSCDPHMYVWFSETAVGYGSATTLFTTIAVLTSSTDIVITYGASATLGTTTAQNTILTSQGSLTETVSVSDGAYRQGIDTWGYFPWYYQKVLQCLYPQYAWPVVEVP